MIETVVHYLRCFQQQATESLGAFESHKKFEDDPWQSNLGQGITRFLTSGETFDQIAINYSHVKGESLPPSAHLTLSNCPFEAVGISIIAHPLNPYAPTAHLNLRFFTTNASPLPIWWFGGGFDLTPYYGFLEDCRHWHMSAKAACQPFGSHLYPIFKKTCDEYFYLPHRKEARGIGGLFFDTINPQSSPSERPIREDGSCDFQLCLNFLQSVGEYFLKGYLPIIKRRGGNPFGERERNFQLMRRGRYVEFNLLHDRGTRFGLQSRGRVESILLSLPPMAAWQYQANPKVGSEEEKLTNYYLVPRDWTAPEI